MNAAEETTHETPQTEEPLATAKAEESVTNNEVETTTDEVETTSNSAEVEKAEEQVSDESTSQQHPVSRGQLIDGTVLETTPTSVTVDLGDNLVGVIPGRELERLTRPILESLKKGSQVTVYVVNPHDHEGKIILSINRAIEEKDWQRAVEFNQSQQIFEGNVAGYNKGGLIVRFGRLRGFVPQSQISDTRRARAQGETPDAMYGHMVNDTIYVKVMEVDRSRNRLILSERAADRERRETQKESLIDQLVVGEIREGRVVSLEDFGAFVDIGGAEGLVHLTEISWRHITHPKEVLEVGQTVKVEVISVDKKRKRIGLSIKRQEADPWDEVATTYQVGDLVQATITKMTKFGAFAQLSNAQDIEGLIHISELSENRVSHPKEVVSEGDTLTLRVVKIDVKNRRLGLSLKRVNSAEYLDHDLKMYAPESDE